MTLSGIILWRMLHFIVFIEELLVWCSVRALETDNLVDRFVVVNFLNTINDVLRVDAIVSKPRHVYVCKKLLLLVKLTVI